MKSPRVGTRHSWLGFALMPRASLAGMATVPHGGMGEVRAKNDGTMIFRQSECEDMDCKQLDGVWKQSCGRNRAVCKQRSNVLPRAVEREPEAT
jgi:hypothetical protein